MTGYYHPRLKQFVELVQSLCNVRVGMALSDYKNNELLLYTDSRYKGLDELKFPVTKKDEEIDLKKHTERLKSNPEEVTIFAKKCMLNYWVEKHPDLEFSRQYENLLKLVSDGKTSVKDFEKAIERKHWYSSPFVVIKQEIIEPLYVVTGKRKKKIEEKDLMIKSDKTIVIKFQPFDAVVNSVEVVKSIMEEAKPEQKRLEEGLKKELERERTRYSS